MIYFLSQNHISPAELLKLPKMRNFEIISRWISSIFEGILVAQLKEWWFITFHLRSVRGEFWFEPESQQLILTKLDLSILIFRINVSECIIIHKNSDFNYTIFTSIIVPVNFFIYLQRHFIIFHETLLNHPLLKLFVKWYAFINIPEYSASYWPWYKLSSSYLEK